MSPSTFWIQSVGLLLPRDIRFPLLCPDRRPILEDAEAHRLQKYPCSRGPQTSPQAKSGPLPVFVTKVSMEHGHPHWFLNWPWLCL